MGLAWDGSVLCLRFGLERVEDIRGAALEVLRRVPHVQEAWFLVLPPEDRVGRWEGCEPLETATPCWHWRAGERRLYLVARTAVHDWFSRHTPVRQFVDIPCACPVRHARA